VEERHEEEDVAVAKAVVTVVVVVDLTLIHNKLLHNNSSNSNSNNSSGLVRCQDKHVAVTGNTIKSTATKRRLIVLWHVLILSLNRLLGLIIPTLL